jgi:DNA-binding SARP family transcriptional activator
VVYADERRCGEDSAALELRVLGQLEVIRNGSPATLPPSRKTWALLAYLALTRRPHQREELCEMFWDLPDDPRGA